MYLVINKWVIAVKVSNFSGHYLRNCSTLYIGVLGYIGIVWPKEHSPKVWHIPPGTPCICMYIKVYKATLVSQLQRGYLGLSHQVLPKISENLNILRKPLVLQTCATRCLLLYLSTVSQPTCVFISARVSAFWLFPLHCFHVCLLISKWWMLRSKEFALNFASSSTKLQLKPTKC